MDVATLFDEIPFLQHIGIEVIEAVDGRAEGRLEFSEELSLYKGRSLAHGGVSFALADTVGAAAIASVVEAAVPTVDMCIDYFRPMTTDLRAAGEVVRAGDRVSTVRALTSSTRTTITSRPPSACTRPTVATRSDRGPTGTESSRRNRTQHPRITL